MELEAQIEPVIGPNEVHEGERLNVKAALEAFLAGRDDDETKRLAALST